MRLKAKGKKSMRKKRIAALLCACMLTGSLVVGCGNSGGKTGTEAQTEAQTEEEAEKALAESPMIEANKGEQHIIDDKYRTYYEVFVYSYYDGNGDGIGDIPGLIQRLDYINDGDGTTTEDLGFNGLWLMPVMPSTTYHKYDVTDYCNIDPEYGTLDDFKNLVTECHNRDMTVIIDFVMNHTSSKHMWFMEACEYLKGLEGKEPSESECPYFGYYNFSKTKEADYWYPVSGTEWYYEGKFWSEMPDLNLENETVREEFKNITAFWLDMGVDGFRLDAAKEYYSDNTTANVEVLTWFNDMVKEQKEDAYIVAEVWTDVNTYAKYYESGIDSVFNFAFANSDGLIANVVKGIAPSDATRYGEGLAKLPGIFGKYNENYIDAPFYSNHDMGRSAGYYSGDYAEKQTKIGAAMNLFMNGSAFVYYGEELGMKGAGKDENKRAPMYWTEDKQAEGMCKGPQGMEQIKMLYPSLEEQKEDSYSIYNFYKQAVLLRNRYPEIARGKVTYLSDISDANVCAIIKEYEGSKMILLFNISPEKAVVDLADMSVEGMEASELVIGGMLLTGEEAAQKNATEVVLPDYSVTLLTTGE